MNPESFQPEVTILAIRWTGQPPPGLSHSKGATNSVAESTPVPSVQWHVNPGATNAAAESTPVPTPPPSAPETKEEAPKVEEPNTNAAPVAPTTNFEPGNSSSQ